MSIGNDLLNINKTSKGSKKNTSAKKSLFTGPEENVRVYEILGKTPTNKRDSSLRSS